MVPDIVRLKDNKWLVAGRINVEDLNKEIDINIPESVSYDTFSGFFSNRSTGSPARRIRDHRPVDRNGQRDGRQSNPVLYR